MQEPKDWGVGQVRGTLTIETLVDALGEWGAVQLLEVTRPPLTPAGEEKFRRLQEKINRSRA